MNIAFAGASGSGKSTMARYISETFGIKYTEQSAGKVMQEEDRRRLTTAYDFQPGKGQESVIIYSAVNPTGGAVFQEAILDAREEQLSRYPGGVYDRSALDPAVFFLNQCVQHFDDENTLFFLKKCARVLAKYDLIIKLDLICADRTLEHVKIEDNGSRIHNKFFQLKIDRLFNDTFYLLNRLNTELSWHFNMPVFRTVGVWQLQTRRQIVKAMIESMGYIGKTINHNEETTTI